MGRLGRAKGTLNRVTVEARLACEALVDDPFYRKKLRARLGSLNRVTVEARLACEALVDDPFYRKKLQRAYVR